MGGSRDLEAVKGIAMLNLDGEYPRPLSEVTLRALALYRETLQAGLEPEQTGRGLAIHPASGDYVVADTPTHAGHAMRVRHPEGGTVTLRIGLPMGDVALSHLRCDLKKGKHGNTELLWRA